jgi:hypothetical protein
MFFFAVFLCPVFMCTAFAVPALFASRAWANANSVAASIEAYGHGALRAVSDGNIVTVSGRKTGARTPLNLDITGVSVIWGAELAGDFRDAESGSALVSLTGKGSFEVASYGSIFNSARLDVSAIEVSSDTALVVRGQVRATGDDALAISAKRGTITVEKGGKVHSSRGVAITTVANKSVRPEHSSVTLKDETGIVGKVEIVHDDRYVATFFGDVTVDSEIRVFHEPTDERFPALVVSKGAKVTLTRNARFQGGVDIDVDVLAEGSLFIDGPINFRGLLMNEGAIFNSGAFINRGTFGNKGKFINTGTITNDGTVVNEGTLDTDKGKLINSGVINNIHGKIFGKNNISGKGNILEHRKKKHGGCDAGAGFAGLAVLAAGLFGSRRRAA